MSVNRQPAVRRSHPAADLPERPSAAAPSPAPPASAAPVRSAVSASVPAEGESEKFTEQLNTKMRPSTRQALDDALIVHEYRNRTKSSIQAVIDAAVLEYIDKYNLRRE